MKKCNSKAFVYFFSVSCPSPKIFMVIILLYSTLFPFSYSTPQLFSFLIICVRGTLKLLRMKKPYWKWISLKGSSKLRNDYFSHPYFCCYCSKHLYYSLFKLSHVFLNILGGGKSSLLRGKLSFENSYRLFTINIGAWSGWNHAGCIHTHATSLTHMGRRYIYKVMRLINEVCHWKSVVS